MKTKEEILDKHAEKIGLINFKNAVKQIWLRQLDCLSFIRVFKEAMEEYAQEYYKIQLKDSDCTCCGDQYGMATNPECILHGKNIR